MLTLNLKYECESEYTKYLRVTKYLIAIYRMSQIQIPIIQKIFE